MSEIFYIQITLLHGSSLNNLYTYTCNELKIFIFGQFAENAVVHLNTNRQTIGIFILNNPDKNIVVYVEKP